MASKLTMELSDLETKALVRFLHCVDFDDVRKHLNSGVEASALIGVFEKMRLELLDQGGTL